MNDDCSSVCETRDMFMILIFLYFFPLLFMSILFSSYFSLNQRVGNSMHGKTTCAHDKIWFVSHRSSRRIKN